MSARIEALKELSQQLPYKTLAERISEADFDRVVEFIEDNDGLGHLDFEYAINRMHLDVNPKPKNWAIVQDLLLAANTRVHLRRNPS